MPTAFVLLTTQIGAEGEVLKELKQIANVEAHLVYGCCDIFLRVESESMHELRQVLTWKIRKTRKITSTQTMITV